MERQPFNQSEGADSNKSGKEAGKSGSFNFVPVSPAFERPEHKAVETPRPVERLPLEGVIDWRRDEELRRRPEAEKPEKSHEEDKDSEDDDDDDSKEKGKSATTAKPAVPVQQPVRNEPRPLSEIIAETQSEQANAEDKEEGEKDAEGEGASVAEHAQAVHQPTPSFNTLDFPPVAPRASELPAPEQPAVEMPAAAVTQRVNPAEQVWYSTAEDDDMVPTPPQHQQTTPGVAAQNVYPAQPAVAPAAANVYPGAPAGGGGPNFNQPPAQPGGPGYNYNQMPPFNPNNPAVANTGYNAAPMPGAANPNVAPNTAPVMPIEHPGVPGFNRDPRVGPVAALLGLEYLARKRADRKLERRVNERADDRERKMEEQRAIDSRIMQERQRQLATEQRRQADELQRVRYGNSAENPYVSGLPKPFEAAPSGTEYAVPRPSQAEARPFATPNVAPNERLVVNRQEVRPPVQQNAEGQPVDTPGAVFNIQPNQRVEHSAWHNIVVDEHGHEVAGAIEYGEGFKRERQQEAIRDRIADNSPAGAGATMISAGTPQQDQFGNPLHPGTLPTGLTNPALPTGQPTHADPNHQLQANNKQQSNIANPWFWIMLLLIIAAFFTAAMV